MKLQGTLGYYRVQESSIARAVAHFNVLGLNDNIVVLITGNLTKHQHTRAQHLGKVRTEKVL
jgi:hypothetical protein